MPKKRHILEEILAGQPGKSVCAGFAFSCPFLSSPVTSCPFGGGPKRLKSLYFKYIYCIF